ncbi:MAG TPA: GGDEF domain-containing protein [Acidimicrobiales bacterium]|nr:GGDEF domain-containing protein [Acidimicrobiales bacterium]
MGTDDATTGGTGRGRLRRGHLQFKTEPTGSSVVRALRAIARMYLVVPLFALAAALDRPHVRSWADLWAAIVLGALFVLSYANDLRHLRGAHFSGFVPSRTFAQMCTAVAALTLAGLALGLHGGTFLLLPVIPFLTVALIGNRPMITRGWVVLVVALAIETGRTEPALDALWSTILFAGTAAVVAAMVDEVVRGTIHGLERNRSLAELAAHTSTMGDWPRGLSDVGDRLARAMDVSCYAVLSRAGRTAPLERVFSWPESDWPSWDELGTLPQQALHQMLAIEDSRLVATPARAGDAAVVVVTPFTSVLGSPVDMSQTSTVAALLASMFERSRLISGLMDMANTDELTGVANRRRLFDALEQEMHRARRSGRPLTVAMIDLDHFKRFNDTFGHSAGDELLRRFALRMARRVRAQDLVARYGGEEFCLILPETEAPGALQLVDALRASGAGEDHLGRRVTFSAGLATWNGHEAVEELVFRADASLYRAKAAGRDRVAAAPAADT